MLSRNAWSVHFTSRDLPRLREGLWYLRIRPEEWECWLDDQGIPDGTPYLLSPRYVYDVNPNAYLHRVDYLEGPLNSQRNRARAMAGYFTFLHVARGGKGWRDATMDDHRAYRHWRRQDAKGPRIDGSTWSQDTSHVFQFYEHAKREGWVSEIPIPLREARESATSPGGPPVVDKRGRKSRKVPASYAHDEGGQRIEWLPAASYRRWRDVGVRGYDRCGLPRDNFRGRWASRNSTFTDKLVRTGMRLEEQGTLLRTEIPLGKGPPGYSKFWLPRSIAKRQSARWVYLPASTRRDLTAYDLEDRALVVAEAQAAGRYHRIRRPMVITDPASPRMAQYTSGAMVGKRVDVRLLGPLERRRLFVDTERGLEPAMFWLGEDGMPLSLSTWKDMFTTANSRCEEAGLEERAHAHLCRHTFAVITLEQLQRGHIAALGEMNPGQRQHYQRIFGDPVDWIRRRLGHTSQLSTLIYLHALQELEMETRMALVPDTWEDPRDTPVAELGDEAPPFDLPEAEVTQ
ncbi:integrase [Kitasatospora sp. NPDC092948]|uniref:integrase n=1 Tax=Kitasatospora sp. NPDC092948 TaxID=3364088 RepID=UPI0037F4EE4F